MAVRGAVVAEGRTGVRGLQGVMRENHCHGLNCKNWSRKWDPVAGVPGHCVQPRSTSEAPLSGWRPADY